MELQNKTVLVTGGAGFIGSHLVDALHRYGQTRVRILDNLATGSLDNLAHLKNDARIELVVGDVGDGELLARLLKDVDIVFHLACRGVRHSLGNPVLNHHTNASATLELLLRAQQAKVKRFIHISTSEVYGTALKVPMDENHPCCPETVYGAAKLAGEAYARAFHRTYALPTVVVRPFNNFGPRSHFEGDAGEVIPRFIVMALSGQSPVIFGDGLQTRDFIYAEDTAHWLCRAAQCDELVGQTINLASGTETSVNELFALIAAETGRTDLTPRYCPARPGDVRRHLGGMEKAARFLGFSGRTCVRDGIRKLVAHMRAQLFRDGRCLAEIPDVNWKIAA